MLNELLNDHPGIFLPLGNILSVLVPLVEIFHETVIIFYQIDHVLRLGEKRRASERKFSSNFGVFIGHLLASLFLGRRVLTGTTRVFLFGGVGEPFHGNGN